MRDSDEPPDELTKALRNDDVITFLNIISNRNDKINDNFIFPNIFENFIDINNTKYINYAVSYGSINCFNYLLLNHHELDSTSFSYAVYGGNIEFIKIVEQNLKTNNEISNLKNESEKVGLIIPSIMKHQNKIFDWILEQKFADKDKNDLPRLIDSFLLNGNAHSLIELIDKGFTFSDNSMI